MNDLDFTDIKILQMLQANARLTNKEIAAQLNLTITPVFERVRKLERKGYIKQYAALVDAAKLGRGMTVFLKVKLAQHRSEAIMNLIEAVNHLPEVTECYHIAGEDDFLLKVLVRDMAEYEDFIVNKLTKLEVVGNVRSNFVMSVVKQQTAISLSHLLTA